MKNLFPYQEKRYKVVDVDDQILVWQKERLLLMKKETYIVIRKKQINNLFKHGNVHLERISRDIFQAIKIDPSGYSALRRH